jgi:ribose transport system permease protein
VKKPLPTDNEAGKLVAENLAPGADAPPPRVSTAMSVRSPDDVARGLGRIAGTGRRLRFSQVGGIYVLAITIAAFAIAIPGTFLTSTTLNGILGDQAITLIVSLGLLAALATGSFDLSVGQNLGFSAVLCGWLTVHAGENPVLAVLLTIGAGAIVGIINGVLVIYVGVDSFIATLGMTSILLALAQIVSSDNFIGPLPSSLQTFADWHEIGVSGYTVYAVILALIAWILLEHTSVGRRAAATGAGLGAAQLAGVPTARYRFVALVLCAVFAAFGGVLLAASIGAVSPTAGPEYLLPAFAACFLSATQFKPGRFNVGGTVLALLLLGTGVAGFNLLGGQVWVSNLFTGAALIVAVSFAVLGQRLRTGGAGR